MQEVPSAYQTQINDILLTVLIQTWQEIYNNNTLLIELEGHGREDIIENVDISRTVGWFTTIYPLISNLSTTDPAENTPSKGGTSLVGEDIKNTLFFIFILLLKNVFDSSKTL